MSAHSKGKWHVQSMMQGGIKMFGVFILNKDGTKGQRWCAISTTMSLEEEEANARLMAKAPEMLKTLRGLIKNARREEMPMTASEIKAREIVAKFAPKPKIITDLDS